MDRELIDIKLRVVAAIREALQGAPYYRGTEAESEARKHVESLLWQLNAFERIERYYEGDSNE